MSNTENLLTTDQFVERWGLKLVWEQVDHRTDIAPHLVSWAAKHWACTIIRPPRGDEGGDQLLECGFSGGKAVESPTLYDILYSMSVDALGIENADGVEDWAAEFGDDPKDKDTRATYKSVKAFTQRWKEFLGEEAYQQLLEGIDWDA